MKALLRGTGENIVVTEIMDNAEGEPVLLAGLGALGEATSFDQRSVGIAATRVLAVGFGAVGRVVFGDADDVTGIASLVVVMEAICESGQKRSWCLQAL